MTVSIPPPAELRASLRRDGFVVIRQILTPEELTSLRAAAGAATELARTGGWPRIRTVGKQFPPWPATPGPEGIWGVQSLLHPDLPGHEAFARVYFADAVLGVVRALIAAEDPASPEGDGLASARDADLVLELFNMLVRPGEPFELRWHRDDIRPEATADEEMARLARPAWHAQWNLALYDDPSLVVVPGSHARARTDAERAADPFAPHLPGQLVVELGPGDVVFYNNNILHRGVYDAARERMSLHGSVGHVSGGPLRARNVLQHGVGEWVDRLDYFGSALGDGKLRAEGMRDRLKKLGTESGEVGYSQDG